jgi:threonine dehydrogenase-like Zn-dependent dehydrogenase
MDIDQKRLDVALALGADEAILIAPDATPADLKKHFPSGVEVVFETSGVPGAATRALALTKMGGTLLLLGLNKTPQEFPFADAVLREVTLETTVAHVCRQDMPEALEMLESGAVAKLLTGQIFKLDEINEAMEVLTTGKAIGKILIAVK